MSNSIWKTPDQKPDGFKPHRILVIYEAHDEPELMFSPQYDTLTDHRYVNRWCYWDEFIAQADKAERLQKAVDVAVDALKDCEKILKADRKDWGYLTAHIALNQIEALAEITALDQKENQ